MKYWLDTEFVERPYTIDLISIGIVAEDGREFYNESSEVDWAQAHPWVVENVKPYLEGEVTNRQNIAKEICRFVGDDTPEFWGYYADFDWVVFCWLFGSMVDLPNGWPMYCRDIKQWADSLGNPTLPEQTSTEHHALADARWNRTAWESLGLLQADTQLDELEAAALDAESSIRIEWGQAPELTAQVRGLIAEVRRLRALVAAE